MYEEHYTAAQDFAASLSQQPQFSDNLSWQALMFSDSAFGKSASGFSQ